MPRASTPLLRGQILSSPHHTYSPTHPTTFFWCFSTARERAEGDKIVQIKIAEANAESKYLTGVGVAKQRKAIVDGLRESIVGFSGNVPGTTAKDVMDLLLLTQVGRKGGREGGRGVREHCWFLW